MGDMADALRRFMTTQPTQSNGQYADGLAPFTVPPAGDVPRYYQPGQQDIMLAQPYGPSGNSFRAGIGQFLDKVNSGHTVPGWVTRLFTDPPPEYGDIRGAIDRAVPMESLALTGGMPMAARGAAGAFGGRLGTAAKPAMKESTPVERAEAMGFRANMPLAFGVVPEGERVASAAINVGGRIFKGPTHLDAMQSAERALGIPFDQMEHGPILDGFVTNTGRYVSRWEAADLAALGEQGKTGGIFGATRGLASEDTAMSSAPPSGKFNIGATAPGLPGGQGVWGYRSDIAPPGTQTLWHRTERPAAMDAQGVRDYELQSSLQGAWEAGHDAVLLKNYTTPAGKKTDVIVVKDPAQLRSPNAEFNPRKRSLGDILSSAESGAKVA